MTLKKVSDSESRVMTITDSLINIPIYRVSQNSRIPNSERGREGPSGARKILRKKIRSS
jgi:cell shape-determining protein MreC